MMAEVTQIRGESCDRPFLSAVMPLNVQRRDDALYLLAREYGNTLTPYEICKTQVLADVRHVLQTGRAIFGGTLYAMPFGPVPERALDDCKRWTVGIFFHEAIAQPIPFDQQPLQPCGWTGTHNHIAVFRASSEYNRREQASWDGFSDDEQADIRQAYAKVISMPWQQSQSYFHEPVSAIGYAYDLATKPFPRPFKGRARMNWFDVLDGAEKIEGADVNYARAMLRLWT